MIWKRGGRKAYPKNAPGDFYVAEDCCTLCGITWIVAPDHFEVDERQGYVKRQLASDAEVDAMISAMGVQELDCIRYKGRDRHVIAALRARGHPSRTPPLDIQTNIAVTCTDEHAEVRLGAAETFNRRVLHGRVQFLLSDDILVGLRVLDLTEKERRILRDYVAEHCVRT
jgi:hypothetical protein